MVNLILPSHASFLMVALTPVSEQGGGLSHLCSGYNDSAYAVVVQDDEKVLVAGSTITAKTGRDFAVVRYLPNGKLDNSFGKGGKVTTAISSSDDSARDLVVQRRWEDHCLRICEVKRVGMLSPWLVTCPTALSMTAFNGNRQGGVTSLARLQRLEIQWPCKQDGKIVVGVDSLCRGSLSS